MKRTEAKSVKDVIDEALRAADMSTEFKEHEASYQWASVVGPGVNRYTTRRYVSRGVMHVYISSGPLKSELQFMRSRLIEQLNRAVGQPVITDLVIH